MTLSRLLYLNLLLCFLIVSCSDPLSGSLSSSECRDTNCADYNSRAEAQADFDWNPDCRADLDADKDGLACEENNWTDYYNSLNNNGGNTSGCPTTSNCGCSGKNKSECENDICCRWIVGTGCKCR